MGDSWSLGEVGEPMEVWDARGTPGYTGEVGEPLEIFER